MENKIFSEFYKKNYPIDEWHSSFNIKLSNFDITLFLQEDDVEMIVNEVFNYCENNEKKWGDKIIEVGCAPKNNQFYSDHGTYKIIDDGCILTNDFIVKILHKYNYHKNTNETKDAFKTKKTSFFNLF